jgi:Zn-dependent peptidase ImmA (M78 family)
MFLYNVCEVRELTYNYTPLEDYVKNLYQRLSIFVPTDIDMFYICDQLNIQLHFYDDGSVALEHEDTPHIFIDKRLTTMEQWQDFGHELCHILKHHGNQLYLSSNQSNSFIKLQEYQAENFMYQFCVPTFMLQDYDIANFHTTNECIEFISNVFHVTHEFSIERLIRYKRKLLQAEWDKQFRGRMDSKPTRDYSDETKAILQKLYTQINNRKVV